MYIDYVYIMSFLYGYESKEKPHETGVNQDSQ